MMGKTKVIRNTLMLFIGVLIFVFLIAFKFDLSSFISAVSDNISWRFYIFISLLVILQLAIRSFRFNLLFNRIFEAKISLKDSFLLTGASFFVAMATPSKLGDTTRGLLFREKGVEITAVTMIEYLFDTFALVGIAFLGLTFVCRQYLGGFILALAILVVGLAILFYFIKCGKAEKFADRFNWYRKIRGKIELLKSHFKAGIRSKFVLTVGFTFSCFFIAIYFFIFYLVLHRLGADTSIIDVFLSVGVGMFIGTLTFIPMGMGTRDVSTYGLLCSVGTDPQIAISSVVIMRSLFIPLMLVSSLCYFLAINRFANKEQKHNL